MATDFFFFFFFGLAFSVCLFVCLFVSPCSFASYQLLGFGSVRPCVFSENESKPADAGLWESFEGGMETVRHFAC